MGCEQEEELFGLGRGEVWAVMVSLYRFELQEVLVKMMPVDKEEEAIGPAMVGANHQYWREE